MRFLKKLTVGKKEKGLILFLMCFLFVWFERGGLVTSLKGFIPGIILPG